MKKTLLSIAAIIFVFGSILLYNHYEETKFQRMILQNYSIAPGVVKGLDYVAKQGYILNYRFDDGLRLVDGTYTGKSDYPALITHIRKKSFPVIYNKDHTEYNHILISPEDFEKFNLAYPDSLYWVKRLMREY